TDPETRPRGPPPLAHKEQPLQRPSPAGWSSPPRPELHQDEASPGWPRPLPERPQYKYPTRPQSRHPVLVCLIPRLYSSSHLSSGSGSLLPNDENDARSENRDNSRSRAGTRGLS